MDGIKERRGLKKSETIIRSEGKLGDLTPGLKKLDESLVRFPKHPLTRSQEMKADKSTIPSAIFPLGGSLEFERIAKREDEVRKWNIPLDSSK